MRNQARYAFGVVAVLAAGSMGFVTAQDEGPSITLAQAQQPATPAPAPAEKQQSPGPITTMPGQMGPMGPGGMMGHEKMGKGPMGPGSMGHGAPAGAPPCPSGQTASGTPPTCK